MKPVNFKEQTGVLGKPEQIGNEECVSLPVFRDGDVCISCWEFTDEEIAKLIIDRKVWLHVFSGETQPPVAVSLEYPFVGGDEVMH